MKLILILEDTLPATTARIQCTTELGDEAIVDRQVIEDTIFILIKTLKDEIEAYRCKAIKLP